MQLRAANCAVLVAGCRHCDGHVGLDEDAFWVVEVGVAHGGEVVGDALGVERVAARGDMVAEGGVQVVVAVVYA